MQNKCNELGIASRAISDTCAQACESAETHKLKARGERVGRRGGGPVPQRTALPYNTFSGYVHVFLYRVSTGRFGAALLLGLPIYFLLSFRYTMLQ